VAIPPLPAALSISKRSATMSPGPIVPSRLSATLRKRVAVYALGVRVFVDFCGKKCDLTRADVRLPICFGCLPYLSMEAARTDKELLDAVKAFLKEDKK